MAVFTKRAVDVFAPYDAAGNARNVDNGESQIWGTEVERGVDGATAGRVDASTWSDLSAIAGDREGQPGIVWGPDSGTHIDPVSGQTVSNEGLYAWSTSPAGWRRVGELPNEVINATNTGAGTADDVQAITVPGSFNDNPYQVLISVNFVATNAGAMTLSLNGEPPRDLVTNTGASIPANYVHAGMAALVMIDGNGDYRFFSYGDIEATVEALLAEFQSQYLGSHPDDSSATAAAGGSPVTGALYFNDTVDTLRYWDGDTWETIPYATAADGSITDAKVSSPSKLFSRINDSINILDYATSDTQRANIRNGTTGFKAVYDDAVADAIARGIKAIDFPDGNFELDDGIIMDNPGLHIRGRPGGTYLYKNGPGRMFQTLGTKPTVAFNLTANAAAGASSVALSAADAANFTVGSRAVLRSNLVSASNSARDAEFVNIIGVNTTTGVITFASPIYFAYATANTAQLYILPPLVQGVGYENLIIDWADGTPTVPQRPPFSVDEPFVALFCHAPRFVNVATKWTFAKSIELHGCVDAYVSNMRGKDGFSAGTDMADAFSYGIHESGLNVGLIATGLQFERMRHGYSTGGADGADPEQFNGGHPFYSQISNGIHVDAKEAGWDTHAEGIGITFSNLHAKGAKGAGIQIRNRDTRLNGCSARDIGPQFTGNGGHGLWIVGGQTSNQWAKDCKVDGFVAYNCHRSGIWNQADGVTHLGGEIHIEKCNEPGITATSTAVKKMIIDGNVYMRDVAKAPDLGASTAYAIICGGTGQQLVSIKSLFVDDPNNNLARLVRRFGGATPLELGSISGRNSTGGLQVVADTTSLVGVNVLPINLYDANGASIGKTFDPSNNYVLRSSVAATSDQAHQVFNNPNGPVGSIITSGTGTSLVQTSDGVLKVNRVSLDQELDIGAIIDAIVPQAFDWLSGATGEPTGERGHGFIAQDVHAVNPKLAIPGNGKEPGSEDFIPWQMSMQTLVPYIWAELRSLRKRVADLENPG